MVVTFSVPTHYRVLIRGATNINQTLSRSDNGLYGVAPSATIACLHLRAGFPVQAPIASQLCVVDRKVLWAEPKSPQSGHVILDAARGRAASPSLLAGDSVQ